MLAYARPPDARPVRGLAPLALLAGLASLGVLAPMSFAASWTLALPLSFRSPSFRPRRIGSAVPSLSRPAIRGSRQMADAPGAAPHAFHAPATTSTTAAVVAESLLASEYRQEVHRLAEKASRKISRLQQAATEKARQWAQRELANTHQWQCTVMTPNFQAKLARGDHSVYRHGVLCLKGTSMTCSLMFRFIGYVNVPSFTVERQTF